MLKISRLTVENMETGCVTDNPQPRVSYCLESDRQNVTLKKAVIPLNLCHLLLRVEFDKLGILVRGEDEEVLAFQQSV